MTLSVQRSLTLMERFGSVPFQPFIVTSRPNESMMKNAIEIHRPLVGESTSPEERSEEGKVEA